MTSPNMAHHNARALLRHRIEGATIESVAVWTNDDMPHELDVAGLILRRPDGSRAVIKFRTSVIDDLPGWAELAEWPAQE